MVSEKEVAKLRINVSNTVFSTRDLYEVVRKIGERLRYTVIEKEQEAKAEKYGYKRKFVFRFDREFDTFARAEITVEMEFTDMDAVTQGGKHLDKGDASIVVKAILFLDYMNKWAMKKSHRTLFSVYQGFHRDRLKRKYYKPLDEDAEKIHDAIREALDKYH